jgi:hypothetical protein
VNRQAGSSQQTGLTRGLPGALRVQRERTGLVGMETLAQTVRSVMAAGTVEVAPGLVNWQHKQRRVIISVTRTPKGQLVCVEESLQRLGSLTFAGVIGGVGGGFNGGLVGLVLSLGGGPFVAIALAGATVVGAIALARWIFLREVNKRSTQLIRLADQLGGS